MLTEEIKREIESHIHEPEHRHAACTEALRIVQQHEGWISDESIRDIADFLGMTPDELDSVATFYNLIHRRPVGKHVIRVCSSVSCWVMGYENVQAALLKELNVPLGGTSADGRFTVLTNQCLGTCDHAPALMIDGELIEDVNPAQVGELLARYQ